MLDCRNYEWVKTMGGESQNDKIEKMFKAWLMARQ